MKDTKESTEAYAVSKDYRELERHSTAESIRIGLIRLFLFIEELITNDHWVLFTVNYNSLLITLIFYQLLIKLKHLISNNLSTQEGYLQIRQIKLAKQPPIIQNPFMQCVSCFLRYNVKSRKPTVIPCGHTICQDCLKKVGKCRVCDSLIIPGKDYPINYSLMEILQKDTKEIDKYVKVCFVGSSTTGKTSLIKRLIGNEFLQQTILTVGYDFCFFDRVVDTLQVRYQLWDSAGQQRYRAISPIHYKNADIVVLVYDMSSEARNNKVSSWLEEAVENCPRDAKVMIIGNKIDLIKQNKVHRPVDQNAWNLIQKKSYTHMQVSCKTAFGISQFWEAIDKELIKKLNEKKKDLINFDKQLEFVAKKKQKMTKIKSSKISKNKQPVNNSSSCPC